MDQAPSFGRVLHAGLCVVLWPWLWTALDPENAPSTILPSGPLLAALIVLAIIGGWSAVWQFLKRIVQWRVGLRWYALVLLLPPAITIGAVALAVQFGPTWEPNFPGGSDLAARFVFILLFIGLGKNRHGAGSRCRA